MNLCMLNVALAHGIFRMLTVINILFIGLLLAITVAYRFPPQMALALVIFVLFIASLFPQGAASRIAARSEAASG